MAQRAQVIDITKSYLPGDPNAFVQSLVNTDREDGEEKTLPVLPYEGYNFLPTSYGYRSYFGVNTLLDVDSLGSNVQFILSYQLADYTTKLLALAEDGIWSCDANTSGAPWIQEVTLTYTDGVFEEWTWCVIENILYMYQQGRAVAYKTAEAAGVLTIATHTPTFLNMTGQMGIFKAGLRLGFWDSANSISWSSNLDLTDFTPALETLAGNTIFGDIIGRIITVKSHGEGFIVYCTKATVGVNFDASGNLLWDAKKIFDNVGISYSRAVTYGQSDAEHFVYSTNGIYRIGKYNSLSGKHEVENLVPDVYDFLRESRDPIYLDTINSRFIFFHILDPDYVYGLTSFTYVTPEDLNVRFTIGGRPWDGEDLPEIDIDGNAAAEAIRQLVTFGFVSSSDTTALWTLITSETQDGTIGPLSSGGGTRNAATPGFTTADIISTYIDGSTLPGELEDNVLEHTNIANVYLGNIPAGMVTVDNAMGESVVQVMLKQKQDWELFRQHQANSLIEIVAAEKTTEVVGVAIIGYGTPPSPPAPDVTNTLITTIKTGEGSIEIQKDKPLRKLVMRKYWQRSAAITKRTTETITYRAGGSSATILTMTGNSFYPLINYTPQTFDATISFVGIVSAGNKAAIEADILSQAPASSQFYTYNGTKFSCTIYLNTPSAGQMLIVVVYKDGVTPWEYHLTRSMTITDNTPYYEDTSTVIDYTVAYATEDMGHVDLQAQQVSHAHTIIQVTSSPATIVVNSIVPIFPTGPSAINFFPPTWTGVETLKLIAASSLSPWHLIDGTFGIELIGDPLAGAAADVDTGGLVALGSHTIGADFGLTYSSFPYVLQVGSPFIYYPTFRGSLVLDLALKKWGKQKNDFQVLIDLQPINQFSPGLLTNLDRGMDAALQLVDQTIMIFDEEPDDSRITYGKIGGYRLGMTDFLECRVHNRRPCTGVLSIDSSMDGRTIDASLQFTVAYASSQVIEAYPDISARWHVITMSGIYDLTGLEARTTIVSRR